ncbi:aldo/keto reductase [Streptomyces sp. NPDC050287]|uniref:aldo/keto reductase n=1 Tax=Streptomyces sp. NPDC050287 TaxID=3365608 RepID=UPI0037B2DA0D
MRTRALGPRGAEIEVSALGLGTLSMSGGYGVEDPATCEATVRRALDLGVTFIDTADFYAGGEGERQLGRALGTRRDEAVICVKTGIRPNPEGGMMLDGSPEYLRSTCDSSLRRLGTDHIDLYCLGWVDPQVPVEESVGALAELVTAGKVRGLMLSEVSPATLRRAHAVHPIAAVATEYSLWQRHVEGEILAAQRQLGVPLIAYSPLGRGFFTGTVRSLDEVDEGDWRHNFPRFAPGNIERNLVLLKRLEAVAERLGVPMSRLAIAWVLAQGEDIVALAGTKFPGHLEDNAAAVSLELGPAELAELSECFPASEVAGARYAPQIEELLDV